MIDNLNLMAEWLATPSINSRQRRQLAGLGATREAVHRCGGLGWARISIAGRVYMPSSAGDEADAAAATTEWWGGTAA